MQRRLRGAWTQANLGNSVSLLDAEVQRDAALLCAESLWPAAFSTVPLVSASESTRIGGFRWRGDVKR